MAELFDYMSWNIKQFSEKRSLKELLMKIEVKVWIAELVLDASTNLLGVMEVTLATGEAGCEELKDALNNVSSQRGTAHNWQVTVSDKSASSSRADKYALLYNSREITIQNDEIADYNINWSNDRAPLSWQTKTQGSKSVTVNCMLWHAPQPKYHKKASTIQAIASAVVKMQAKTKVSRFVISGDFNYDTGTTAVYKPLTDLAFSGVFNGELTTLTTLKSFLKNNGDKLVKQGNYDEAYLANAYDNIFVKGVSFSDEWKAVIPAIVYEELMTSTKFQIVTRSKAAEALAQAGQISDHLPVVITVNS